MFIDRSFDVFQLAFSHPSYFEISFRYELCAELLERGSDENGGVVPVWLVLGACFSWALQIKILISGLLLRPLAGFLVAGRPIDQGVRGGHGRKESIHVAC